MRLVWVVIPLILIGIIGVQESFATESILLYSSKLNDDSTDKTSAPGVIIPHDQKITLSKIPKLGEIATISVTVNLKPEFSQLQGNSTQKIMLEKGFSFVNIDASLLTLSPKTNLLSYSESLPVVMNVPTVFEFEITPTKVGTWTVHVDGGNYKQRHSFDFIVNDNETILDENQPHKSGFVVENITSKNIPLSPSESVSSPISGEMSLSNIPKLGETAQLTVTKHIDTISFGYLTTGIGLIIPPGFELVDAGNLIFNEENTEILQHSKGYENVQVFSKEVSVSDSDEIQTITSVVTIKAVQTGNWTLNAPPSSLNVVVGEDESFLLDFFPSLPVPYSSTEPEPPPKPINIRLSPKKQLESGVTPEKITCYGGLDLIFKSYNNSPVCVKPQTAEKLVERGWTS